jgi:SpoIID/LytB domain protein
MSLPARLQEQALIVGAWAGRRLNRRRRPRRGPAALLGAALVTWMAAVGASQAPAVPPEAATLVLEWPSGRATAERRADILDTPVPPGSIAKIFALAAAAEAGLVPSGTTHLCRRVATADGRRFVCAHPDLKRPLTPAEALAYSCNDFFVQLAGRLPRARLNDVRRRAGLDPVPDSTPYATAVLGLAGPPISPRALLRAVTRVVGAGPEPAVALAPAVRSLVLEGMRGAAEYGSAVTLGMRRPGALAKTGTAPMPGGRSLGMVVAFAPGEPPLRAAVVAAPGGAGIDAAQLAGELLAVAPAPVSTPPVPAQVTPAAVPVTAVSDEALRAASRGRTIRIGVTRANGSVRTETLAVEQYVARVISGEGQPRAGRAAHEALAIVIRTFAAANQRRHRAEGYDLCDTTHCQVMRPAIDVARQAALATAGRVLLDRGTPAFVYYSALCGGIPALASEVWPGATDYRPGEARDDACADEPAWSNELRADQVEQALRAAGLRGQRLRGLRVVDRTNSQRADTLRAEGFTPSEISAHELRMAVGRTLGWQWLRSTAFDVTRTAAGYRFRGVGYGHGVGLCVIGAGRRAARGESADQILRAYFGPLTISGGPPIDTPAAAAPPSATPAASTSPAPDIRLALPAADEGDRAVLTGLVRRARTEIATRAGVPEPQGLTLTVHPTVESFGRATGQPWWVAAATVGTTIDLLPIGVLRQRGIFESTVRHEIAHVVVDRAIATRPRWVREGVALYFAAATRTGIVPPGRPECPSDAELLRPVSAGAQREAYSRAERCVRRALAAGTSWQDIR